jgi:hypothetical protein
MLFQLSYELAQGFQIITGLEFFAPRHPAHRISTPAASTMMHASASNKWVKQFRGSSTKIVIYARAVKPFLMP